MKRLTIVLYEISLWLLAMLAFPKMIYDVIFRKKYRDSFLKRFGWNLPAFEKKQNFVIWLHAVSLGETKACATLAKKIKEKFPDCVLIVSSITETGHVEAKKSISYADYHIYLPFDFTFIIKKFIKRFSPDLVLLSETDFWFNFLYQAHQKGAQIALVNGKLSERSAHRFAKFPFLSTQLFNLFDLFCLQNSCYLERFLSLGIKKEKCVITGNLKFDDTYPFLTPEEVLTWRRQLSIADNAPLLTIGSTHDPEELQLIEVLKSIEGKFPNLKVLLIPRHSDRCPAIGKMLSQQGITWINYTDLPNISNAQLILFNVMGSLRTAYQLSDVALVGGSFTNKVGGHNILEPCYYGKPVVFGPFMHTQVEFVELVENYQCGIQANLEDLPKILIELLQNSDKKERFYVNGMQMMHDLQGSTNRTLIALEPLFKKIIKKSTK